jgi:hypothetical protein
MFQLWQACSYQASEMLIPIKSYKNLNTTQRELGE